MTLDWQQIQKAQQAANRVQQSVDWERIRRAADTWERVAKNLDWQRLQEMQQSQQKVHEALEKAQSTVNWHRVQDTVNSVDLDQLRRSLQVALENYERVEKALDWQQLAEAARVLRDAQESEDKWQSMRHALKEKTKGELTALNREEIETIGRDVGLDPDEAAELFRSHKDISWRGDFISSDERGWIAVWIEEIS